MSKIKKLKGLSFLVYGLGLTGLSVIKFFKKNKIKNFKIWDDKKKKIFKNYAAKNLTQILSQVDYIVLSPGISLIKNKKLRKFKHKIITDIDLFYLTKNKSKTIVVTGTNGKSTTCKLLAHILKKNKFKVSLGGNIGNPILNAGKVENKYVVIEASSFQLSHSNFICPDYAFFLNLTNDHLDWHGSRNNYIDSKFKIFRLQTKNDIAIINSKLKKNFTRKKFSSRLIIPKKKDYTKIKSKIINKYLISNINDENMSFVFTFAKLLGIKESRLISSINSFKGLPHRFELFLKKNDITFINDSKATSFKSAQLALSSINNIYWILGGQPKIGDKIKLGKLKENIIKCYIIGKNINFFKNQIKGQINFSITRNLSNSIIKILKDIKIQKKINKTILLSPAAASFDQFANFEKRGEKFKFLCKKYVRKFV
jgi:UDP-N-acetylmuramoylalanine--D-glutamate ligase